MEENQHLLEKQGLFYDALQVAYLMGQEKHITINQLLEELENKLRWVCYEEK